MTSLYDMSVPIAIQQLTNLQAVLKKAEQWCKDNNKPETTITEGKLADDMLPLTFQVQTSCNGICKSLGRIGADPAPSVEDNEKTFAELDARLTKTIDILKGVKKEQYEGKDNTPVEFTVGPYELKFTGLTYLQRFVLPNLFFHTTTAYAICRSNGVQVGKFDFLGPVA